MKTQTITIKLRNGDAHETQAYVFGVLAVHKSTIVGEKGLWKLTHVPTSGNLASALTRKELIAIASTLNAYAEEHLDLLAWCGTDHLTIFTGKDGSSHRAAIAKICGRMKNSA